MDKSREKIIIRTSIIGIIANVVLAAFKAVLGVITNSIAITLDAVNNLSDVVSSVITIVGTALAAKAPDKKHPLGHGRIEYITQSVIAAIILYAGITSLIESVKKIVRPEAADYSIVSLVIIAVAIVVKVFLSAYVKRVGQRVNSGSLIASGSDASFDAILSASVLASAILFMLTGVSLEAYVGVIISIAIVKSGIEMITDAVDEILGVRTQGTITKEIRRVAEEETQVHGAYDILLHNYGPDRLLGSMHVEVDDTMTAGEIDVLTRRLQRSVFEETGVIITTVGIYSHNTSDDKAEEIRRAVTDKVMEHEGLLQLHGFYVDEETKDLRFDVIIDFSVKDREALYRHIIEDVQEMYPEYNVRATLDIDVSD